jgi:hypothetical protein
MPDDHSYTMVSLVINAAEGLNESEKDTGIGDFTSVFGVDKDVMKVTSRNQQRL